MKGAARPCSQNGEAAGPGGKVAGMAGDGPAAQIRRPSRRPKAAARTATAEEEPGAAGEAALMDTEEAEAAGNERLGAAGQRRHRPRASTDG